MLSRQFTKPWRLIATAASVRHLGWLAPNWALLALVWFACTLNHADRGPRRNIGSGSFIWLNTFLRECRRFELEYYRIC